MISAESAVSRPSPLTRVALPSLDTRPAAKGRAAIRKTGRSRARGSQNGPRSGQDHRAIAVQLAKVTSGQSRGTGSPWAWLVSGPSGVNRSGSQADSASSILVTRSKWLRPRSEGVSALVSLISRDLLLIFRACESLADGGEGPGLAVLASFLRFSPWTCASIRS
jgi:hypothetical protein